MIIESWKRWEPAPNLCKKYYAKKLVEDYYGVSILLTGHDKPESKLLLQIDQATLNYTVAHKSLMNNRLNTLANEYGTDFHKHWTFFKIDNSEYIKWIDHQSGTIATIWSSKMKPIQHFCLITMEEVIDVIAYGEPKVTLL